MIKVKPDQTKKTLKWCLYLAALGLTIYPIIIRPMLNPSYYKDIQRHTRRDIVQEDVQPGNMRVWSSPFGEKK